MLLQSHHFVITGLPVMKTGITAAVGLGVVPYNLLHYHSEVKITVLSFWNQTFLDFKTNLSKQISDSSNQGSFHALHIVLAVSIACEI